MINVQNIGIKPYMFMDGEKCVFTKNPSQKMYTDLMSMKDDVSLDVLDTIFDYMLKTEDRHYKEDLSFDVKILLVQDYIQYHAKNLTGSISSTSAS